MLNKIHCGKSEEVIDQIESNSVNLIITSPPYNVDLGNTKSKRGGYDIYDDKKEHDDFLNDRRIFFYKAKRVLTDDARICINIGDTENGKIPVGSDLIHIMTKELGYLMYTTIVWNKNNQTSNRCSWGSWKSPSAPSFPTPFEYILIFANKSRKLLHQGETDLDGKEFVDWSLSYWNFTPEIRMKKYEHPAMFPKELPKRLIKMLSYKGDTVLDPYCGTGTTCVVAKRLERNYIGIEMSPSYCDIANKRIDKVMSREELSFFC